MALPVSVLDLVGMRAEESPGSAIARTIDLAQHVEQWGYRRFWLAEQHSISGLACSATPGRIGHVANGTRSIRVGSGGVMLPNHAPLVVAEQFGTLEALYPGRIDLGLGRAPGGDFQTMRALRRDSGQSGDNFPELLEELRTYLGPERPGQAVKAIPGQDSNVPITLLGSSDFSAQLSAHLGLPFAFAAHFAPELLEPAAKLYRTRSSARVQGSAAALAHRGGAGNRSGDRRGSAAAIHHAAAALSAPHSQPARRVAAARRFNGGPLDRRRACRRAKQAAFGCSWIGSHGCGRLATIASDDLLRRSHRGHRHMGPRCSPRFIPAPCEHCANDKYQRVAHSRISIHLEDRSTSCRTPVMLLESLAPVRFGPCLFQELFIHPLLLLVLAIVFVATVIRSAFGFGEALIAVPLLGLCMPLRVAAPLAVLLSIAIAAVVAQD